MKIVGIIQCRTGSKRLPNKALMHLAGKPMLWRYIERCKRSEKLDELVLATTEKKEDDVLCDIAKMLDIKVFRGSENNLLDRIRKCAIKHEADVIVRLCADNPLIEPKEIDRAIGNYNRQTMFTNAQPYDNNRYPDGIGCEIYSPWLLDWADKHANTAWLKEHPHRFFFQRNAVNTDYAPEEYWGYDKLKLDVNTQEEYDYVSAIYDKFGHNDFHFLDYAEDLCQPHGKI
jgi:spore coat polysaccharide biosynthesis protein SpsF